MRYTLRDSGYPYKSICRGRKQVGRVWKNAEGTFTGKIGATERTGTSFEEAFRNTAAVALGFDTVADVRQHNANVRAKNKVRRARANAELAQVLGPDIMNMLMGLRR